MSNTFEKFNIITKFSIGLAILIIFNLFVYIGINILYKAPRQDDFCKSEMVREKNIRNRQECESAGGIWEWIEYHTTSYKEDAGRQLFEVSAATILDIELPGKCNLHFACQKNFEKTNDIHKRNVFIVWIVVGILTLMGVFYFSLSKIFSISFIFSSVTSLVIGIFGYWSVMRNHSWFIILGVVLAFFIYATYKRLKND